MQKCEYCRGYIVIVENDNSKAFCAKCGSPLGLLFKKKEVWHRRKWVLHKEGLLCTEPNWCLSKKDWDEYYIHSISKSNEWEERTL